MDWYYAEGGQRQGPINDDGLRSLCASGRIRPDTLIWRAGMPEWRPASEADGSLFGLSPMPAGMCRECGRSFPLSDLLVVQGVSVCASCKDVFFQRLREQGAAVFTSSQRFGGFWIRLLSLFIDGMIMTVISLPLYFVFILLVQVPLMQEMNTGRPPDAAKMLMVLGAFSIYMLVAVGLQLLYEAWFIVKRGATPGKLIFGLQILRPDGQRLTWGRAIGRFFGRMLSSLTLMIGYIIAAFDREKRALHDHLCDTRVVYKRA